MKKVIALSLAIVLCLACMSGCAFGTDYTPVASLAAALMEVKAGTADAAFVDSVMAEAMCGPDGDYNNLSVVTNIVLAEEEYAIGFRTGSSALGAVNEALAALYSEGKVAELAAKYNVSSSLITEFKPGDEQPALGNEDLKYIKDKGELIIGYTNFKPLNYEENGKLIGFDTELAEAVCEKIGVKAKFVEISWDNKVVELDAKNIDCIWNGFTVTEELKDKLDFSGAYLTNKQVIVTLTSNAIRYGVLDRLKGCKIVAEEGSSGEGVIKALMKDGTL